MSLELRCRPSRTLQELAYTLPVSHRQTVKLILRRALAHVQKTVREILLTGFIDAAFCEKKLLKHSSEGGANECHQSFGLTRLFLQTTHTCCLSILVYVSCKERDLPISQGFRRIFQKGLSLPVIHVSYSSDNVNTLRSATQDAPVAVSEFKPFGQVHHCF